jgi:hypothetical protein
MHIDSIDACCMTHRGRLIDSSYYRTSEVIKNLSFLIVYRFITHCQSLFVNLARNL